MLERSCCQIITCRFVQKVHIAYIDCRQGKPLDYQSQVRKQILETITDTTSKALWTSIFDDLPKAYAEARDAALHDPRILEASKSFRAADDRHYFTEYTLKRAAELASEAYLPRTIVINRWAYGLVRAGRIAFTQKCVSDHSDSPPAAGFREQLAATNAFNRQGSFDFARAQQAFHTVEHSGILIHAPASRKFEADEFAIPAFVELAFPWADYSGWAARYSLPEIVSAYGVEKEERKVIAPTWRRIEKREDGA
jgi:hypothetical protein